VSRADFAANRKQAEREGAIPGGDYFKYREGKNVFRLLSDCLPHPGLYKGRRTFKWLCYVLDRDAGDVKVHFMPHTVYKAIEALQQTDDYAFDEVPMPYDLTVNAKNAGTKEVEYSVIPARVSKPLTAAEETMLATKKPLDELQAALKDKAREQQATDAPDAEHDESEIPA
jgi:hypothetical protein